MLYNFKNWVLTLRSIQIRYRKNAITHSAQVRSRVLHFLWRSVTMENYPFGSGRPDPGSFPNRELGEAAMRILPEMGDELALYPGMLGYQPLRQVMADRLLQREGVARRG